MATRTHFIVAVTLLSVAATLFDEVAALRVSDDNVEFFENGDHDAAHSISAWNIFDRSGPKLSNVSQGNLGDCYLLAGLAAIAKTHPDFIDGVFVSTGSISRKGRSVYQLRFLNDGKADVVAIDDVVPMQKYYRGFTFHFATFHDGNNAWPLLIEKGFAKIAGSYLAISAGFISESFKALTQAPVDEYLKASSKSWKQRPIYEFINEALENNWPVAAGTAPDWDKNIGTADGHAYAVLGLGVKENNHAVQIYNPWAKNQYTGALQHLSNDSQGDYWMLLSEFVAVFDGVTRARVLPNAHLASQSIPVGPAFLMFSVSTDKPFYVQLQWPSRRSLPRECDYDYDSVNVGLVVTAASTPGAGVAAGFDNVDQGNLRVSMPGKAGEYHVLAVSFFEGMTAISEVVVNVYSEEKVNNLKYHPEVSASSGANLVFGTCDQMKYDGHRFTASASSFRGSPLWTSSGGDIMWYRAGDGLFVSPSKSQYSYGYEDSTAVGCYGSGSGSGGGFFAWLRGLFSWAQLSETNSSSNSTKGGGKLQKSGSSSSSNKSANLGTNNNNNNNKLGSKKTARLVERKTAGTVTGSKKQKQACDQRDVKAKLRRNQNLNNYNELMAGYEDSLFPPSMTSIGEAGVDCGDAATGKRVDCGNLNEWGSITKELGRPDYVPK
mmetsp:Transcript_52679/g.115065  ORF Transcript_52679/g.115065 Transcript_52679/m.115065 type:complete len:662 (-) Transcript_52679:53-2038(-)